MQLCKKSFTFFQLPLMSSLLLARLLELFTCHGCTRENVREGCWMGAASMHKKMLLSLLYTGRCKLSRRRKKDL